MLILYIKQIFNVLDVLLIFCHSSELLLIKTIKSCYMPEKSYF